MCMNMGDNIIVRLKEISLNVSKHFDAFDYFKRACKYENPRRALNLLFTRAIEITDAMMKLVPPELKDMVVQYKKDYELWKAHKENRHVLIEGASPYRYIDGEAVDDEESDDDVYGYDEYGSYEYGSGPDDELWSESGDELWSESYDKLRSRSGPDNKLFRNDQNDERKIDENGRYRWYQRRAGSLYCGLYAIQHLLNDERITKQTLDALSSNTTQLPGVKEADVAEQKSIQSSDLVNRNGNYNINVLSTALNNIGYVTRVLYRKNNLERFRTDPNVVGIIANRGRAHWYAYRIIERQWQECDSLNLSRPFPIVTSAAIANEPYVNTLLVVIQPPGVDLEWVPQANRMRLAQLFYEIQNQ